MGKRSNTIAKKKPELGIQLTDDEFRKLGGELCDMIRSAEAARDQLVPRWKQVTSYYNNENLSDSWKWLKRYKLKPFPLTQPKIDQLCAVLTTSLFSQDRMFLARQAIGGARVEPLEDLVQFFLDQGFETSVDEASPIACLKNHAILYVPFEIRDFQYGKEPCGFSFYVIDPGDFVVYPANSRNLDEALLVGHKMSRTLGQVQYLQGKRYRKCAVTAGQDPAEYAVGTGHEEREPSSPALPEHTPVRLDQIVFEKALKGGKPKRYQAVVAFDTREVLRLDEFPYRKCRYVDLRVKPRQYGGYWSMTSIGQDLQGLQWQYNQLQNLLVAGQWSQAFPWGVTDGKVDKAQELSPLSFLQTSGSTTFPQIGFNAGEIPFMIQQIERQADAVTRVTQESTGVAISKRQTLGEMQSRQAGANQGLTKFLSTFGESLVEVCYTMQEQLSFHYDIWSGVYPEQAKAFGDPDQLELFLDWEPQGKTPDTTGDQILQKLMFVDQQAEKDVQESLALGFDPTFDIGKVRRALANAARVPNVEDLFFDPKNPSVQMQGIISATIQQKAQAMAQQMAEQAQEQLQHGAQQMQQNFQQQIQAKDALHQMELQGREVHEEARTQKAAGDLHEAQMQEEANQVHHTGELHRLGMKAELADQKHATQIHKLQLQNEALKARAAKKPAKKAA